MSVFEKIEFKDYFRIWQRRLDSVRASLSNGLATNSRINAWINKSALKDRYFFHVKSWGINLACFIRVGSAYVNVPCRCDNHSLMLFVGGCRKTLLVIYNEPSIHQRRYILVANADKLCSLPEEYPYKMDR